MLVELGALKAERGDRDGALELQRELEATERAYRERDGILIAIRRYPAFRSLREDSRFGKVVRRMGLDPIAESEPPSR